MSVTKAQLIGNAPLGSASAPTFTFADDPNTGIYSPGADQIALVTGGTARITIDSSGNVTIANRINVPLGSASAPSIYFAGDTNTGIYSPTGDTIALSTGGSERLRLDSSGRLGLGTSAPQSLLDVGAGSTSAPTYKGTIRIGLPDAQSLNANGGLEFFATTFGSGFGYRLGTYDLGGGNVPFVLESRFNSASWTERLRVDASGRLGIGTTTPGSLLDVRDASGSSEIAIHTSGSGGILTKLKSERSGPFRISAEGGSASGIAFETGNSTTPTEKARIDTSGRLLVGTSTGTALGVVGNHQFSVEGASAATSSISTLRTDASTSPTVITLAKSRSNAIVLDGDNVGRIEAAAHDGTDIRTPLGRIDFVVDGTPGVDDMPGRLVFSSTSDGSSSPTEAMRINSSQELLIGYTADNGAYKLQVNSQIFATSATIATSDGRYKENVSSLGGCLDLVKSLRPVSFTWKRQEDITCINEEGNEVLVREGHNFPEGTQVGFIAQEVQEVLKEKSWLGSVIKENVRPAVLDNEGNELAPEEQFYGIAEGNLIAVLTNALQEAISRIESLESEVASLKV